MYNEVIKIKSAEVDGFKVELISESKGMLFRVNATDGAGYPKTRIFTEYAEASALFDSYLQGN